MGGTKRSLLSNLKKSISCFYSYLNAIHLKILLYTYQFFPFFLQIGKRNLIVFALTLSNAFTFCPYICKAPNHPIPCNSPTHHNRYLGCILHGMQIGDKTSNEKRMGKTFSTPILSILVQQIIGFHPPNI